MNNRTKQSWPWPAPPDFFLSPWKAHFTFPPWTIFILKGVAIPLSLFFHLLQNPTYHPRCLEEHNGAEFSPDLPTPGEVLATRFLLCFLRPVQQLVLLFQALMSWKLKRDET